MFIRNRFNVCYIKELWQHNSFQQLLQIQSIITSANDRKTRRSPQDDLDLSTDTDLKKKKKMTGANTVELASTVDRAVSMSLVQRDPTPSRNAGVGPVPQFLLPMFELSFRCTIDEVKQILTR